VNLVEKHYLQTWPLSQSSQVDPKSWLNSKLVGLLCRWWRCRSTRIYHGTGDGRTLLLMLPGRCIRNICLSLIGQPAFVSPVPVSGTNIAWIFVSRRENGGRTKAHQRRDVNGVNPISEVCILRADSPLDSLKGHHRPSVLTVAINCLIHRFLTNGIDLLFLFWEPWLRVKERLPRTRLALTSSTRLCLPRTKMSLLPKACLGCTGQLLA